MTDEECSITFDVLTKTLQDLGFEWVIEQVSDEVARGKSFREKLEIDPGVEGRSVPRSALKGFLTTVEYSAKERLLLLIQAIEYVVVNTVDVEVATLDLFQGFGGETVFVFESESESEHGFRFSRQSAIQQQTLSGELKDHLDSLRELI